MDSQSINFAKGAIMNSLTFEREGDENNQGGSPKEQARGPQRLCPQDEFVRR
jgi:hypothetical protein